MRIRCRILVMALFLVASIHDTSAAESSTGTATKPASDMESTTSNADETEHVEQPDVARRYVTREERRDAGIKHEITPWLTLGALAEVEYGMQRFKPFMAGPSSEEDFIHETLQLGFEIRPVDWSTIEIVYEYDGELDRHIIDEAIAKFEAGDFEIETGKFFVSFGEYFNHFVTGPVLEFGETQGTGIAVSYAPGDLLDIGVFVFDGHAEPVAGGSELDWGMIFESAPFENGKFGISYVSDLADSDEEFLSDFNNRFQRKVPAASAYTVWGFGRMELTAEYVTALGSFAELDPDRNRPRAWNLELAYFPDGKISWAFRLEGSREFEDAPRTQLGVASLWQIRPNIFLNFEILHGKFSRDFAADKFEREVVSSTQFGALLSIEF